MAWIVKESARTTIERRGDAYVTDAMKAHFEKEIFPRYATKQAALLPLMHELQHAYGWIPPQAIEEAAAFLHLTPADVYDTITFYEEFRLKPLGRHVVQVCRSISCELCGQRGLGEQLQRKLGVGPGETTDDGKITYQELECLGACDFAPVALIDGHLQKRATFEKLEAQLERLP
jgi:NADH-quinone oxidoreductase E subunit